MAIDVYEDRLTLVAYVDEEQIAACNAQTDVLVATEAGANAEMVSKDDELGILINDAFPFFFRDGNAGTATDVSSFEILRVTDYNTALDS